MEKKGSLLPQTHTSPYDPPRPKRPTRFHALAFVAVLGLYFLSGSWKCEHKRHERVAETKVPLEVHIM